VASKTGQAQARILAMLLMTLRGTPFLFAGDEIGMEQVSIPPERIQDPFERLVKGFGLGRDPERAPLRWDDTKVGGFTTANLGCRSAKTARAISRRNDVMSARCCICTMNPSNCGARSPACDTASIGRSGPRTTSSGLREGWAKPRSW